MENGPVSYISIKLKGTESKYSENKIQLFETIMIFCLCEFCSIVCKNSMNTAQYADFFGGSRGLMDRALDLKPEVTRGCGFESWLWQEVSMTEVRPLSKAPNPGAAMSAAHCSKCVLG